MVDKARLLPDPLEPLLVEIGAQGPDMRSVPLMIEESASTLLRHLALHSLRIQLSLRGLSVRAMTRRPRGRIRTCGRPGRSGLLCPLSYAREGVISNPELHLLENPPIAIQEFLISCGCHVLRDSVLAVAFMSRPSSPERSANESSAPSQRRSPDRRDTECGTSAAACPAASLSAARYP